MIYASDTSGLKSVTWRVGDILSQRDHDFDVYEVTVDGRDLDYVLSFYKNIPVTTDPYHTYSYGINREMRWFGDHAKFILHNLPCEAPLSGG